MAVGATRETPMRSRYVAVTLPALAGAVLAAIAYLTPNTGVDGTVGALLALAGAVAVTLGSLIAMSDAVRGGLRVTLNILLAIGALLTAVAAYFLMQYWCALAMVLAVAGLAFAAPSSRRPA
jgi:quinoprotein glucose dehydrogenase